MRRVDWGADVVDTLIAQRPPFRFLDRIHAVVTEPKRPADEPFLHGSFLVSPEEPALAGHFPGAPIWPGAYTIEGLAQACGALEALAARERGVIGPAGRSVIGAVDVRLVAPVAPGDRLDYRVWRTGESGGLRTWRVEASVGPRVVARGTLTGGRLASGE